MAFRNDAIRYLISGALVSYMVVVAAYMWFIDLLAQQDQFGLFVATELATLAMLIHITAEPNYESTSKSWLLFGCIMTALFLIAALLK